MNNECLNHLLAKEGGREVGREGGRQVRRGRQGGQVFLSPPLPPRHATHATTPTAQNAPLHKGPIFPCHAHAIHVLCTDRKALKLSQVPCFA